MSFQGDNETPQFSAKRLVVFGSKNNQLQSDCDDKDGRIALMIASRNGDAGTVQGLLNDKAMIQATRFGSSLMQQTIAAMHYQRAFSAIVPSAGLARTELLDSVVGRTPLTCAAERGHTEVVRTLLENDEDVDEKDTLESERSPLHWATCGGHTEVVQLLLQNEADTEAGDIDGDTPRDLAASKGHNTLVDLLRKYSANPLIDNPDYQTPLARLITTQAPGMGDITVLRARLQRLIRNGSDIEQRIGRLEYTPLMITAFRNRVDIAEELLNCGANIEARDSNGMTVLFHASMLGNVEMVRLLLDRNAQPDPLDKQQSTPLDYAVVSDDLIHDCVEVVEILNRPGVVRLFLERKPDLLLRKNILGLNVTGVAIAHGTLEMVKLLLEFPGGNIKQGPVLMAPLCFAAFRGDGKMVKGLIESGVSLNGTDGRYGRNALAWAATQGNHAVFKQLLQTRGIGLNHVDRMGRTTLFHATVKGDRDVFEMLRQRGSNPHHPDRFGLTPLFAAVQRGHEDLVREILKNRPLKHEPEDRFQRSLTWWMRLTGNTGMRELVTSYGMQLMADRQREQGQYRLPEGSDRAGNTCDACTLNLSRVNRGIECGSGCEKYRICHICCEFGVSCEDFSVKQTS